MLLIMNDNVFNPESEFKKFQNDKRDNYRFLINQKRPSVNFLEQFAEKILVVAEKWQSMNEYSMNEVISTRNAIDIFLSDLDSDLSVKDDAEYRIIWNRKYNDLRGIQENFKKDYLQSIDKLT